MRLCSCDGLPVAQLPVAFSAYRMLSWFILYGSLLRTTTYTATHACLQLKVVLTALVRPSPRGHAGRIMLATGTVTYRSSDKGLIMPILDLGAENARVSSGLALSMLATDGACELSQM